MKIWTVAISMIVISMFLAGCALQQSVIEDVDESEPKPVVKKTNPKDLPPESKVERYSVPPDEPEERESEEAITMTEKRTATTTTGDSATFTKIEMYERDKGATEVCDIDYPINCADYLAKDGVIYLSIKNGYPHKIDEVTLAFGGDTCDPVDTMMQPMELKEFECYASRDAEMVSGPLSFEFYQTIERTHQTKTGKLVVLME